MAGRLKVFRAHLGFFDTIIAAPSQKAALAAWGAPASEFRKGFAAVTNDPDAVQAALAQPGVVLRRAFGSKAAFSVEPVLPRIKRSPRAHKKKQDKHATKAAARRKASEVRAEAKKNLAKELERIHEQEDALSNARRIARAAYKRRLKHIWRQP